MAGGGKFANGAAYGAFSYAFGEVANQSAENRTIDKRMAGAASFDYEDALAFESSPYLRVAVPGQIAWDNAVTSWEGEVMVTQLYMPAQCPASKYYMLPPLDLVAQAWQPQEWPQFRKALLATSLDTLGMEFPEMGLELVQGPFWKQLDIQ